MDLENVCFFYWDFSFWVCFVWLFDVGISFHVSSDQWNNTQLSFLFFSVLETLKCPFANFYFSVSWIELLGSVWNIRLFNLESLMSLELHKRDSRSQSRIFLFPFFSSLSVLLLLELIVLPLVICFLRFQMESWNTHPKRFPWKYRLKFS